MPVSAVLTSDQFSVLPDQFDKNGNRIRQELISGELIETPPSFELHNVVKSNIIEGRHLSARRVTVGMGRIP